MRAPPTSRPAPPASLGPASAQLELSKLARPPAEEEVRAIYAAVGVALGLPPPPVPATTSPWRFSGRWWQPEATLRASGAPAAPRRAQFARSARPEK